MRPAARDGRGRQGQRGRGRGRGRPSSRADESTSNISGSTVGVVPIVNKEVEQLLIKSGIHSNKKSRRANELPPSETNAVKEARPPWQIFGNNEESLIDAISGDVQACAEITTAIAGMNSVKPLAAVESLKSIPVERWKNVDALWRDVWGKQAKNTTDRDLFGRVCEELDKDIEDLQGWMHKYCKSRKRLRKAGESGALQESVKMSDERLQAEKAMNGPQWLTKQLERNGSLVIENRYGPGSQSFLPYWSVPDPDVGTIYTDSETENEMSRPDVPPPAVALRTVVRRLQKQEQLRAICARSFRVYEASQDVGDIVVDNIKALEKSFYTDEQSQTRRNRQRWRLWRGAAELGRWRLSTAPYLLAHQMDNNVNNFSKPKAFLIQTLLGFFGKTCPHLLTEPTNFRTHLAGVSTPWQAFSGCETWVGNVDVSADRTRSFKIRSLEDNVRCYVGYRKNMWGGPAEGDAYTLSSTFLNEIVYTIRRCSSAWKPLRVLALNRPRKPRLRVEAIERSKSLGYASAGVGSSTTGIEQYATADVDMSSPSGSMNFGATLKVVAEADSEESEYEREISIKAQQLVADGNSNPATKSFSLSGYSHDNEVVSIGRFGCLRNLWGKPRRKRLGFEGLSSSDGTKYAPIPPDYSSSEDSAEGLIENQRVFRNRPRATRRLIDKQRDRLRKGDSATRTYKILKFLDDKELGPLRAPAAPPQRQSNWQGSPLHAYHERLEKEANASASLDRNEERAGMSSYLGIQEERWTVLTKKKPRVRRFELRQASAAGKVVPDGFMGITTDYAGGEYQLVGIDESNFFRMHGDCKAFPSSLKSFADVLRDTREYFVFLDEAKWEATVVPGAITALFWTKSPRENLRSLHAYLAARSWLTGRYRKKFLQKLLRYQKLARQGNFAWQKELDKLDQISDRQMELSAFCDVKYLRPRVHSWTAKRLLDLHCRPAIDMAKGADTQLLTAMGERETDEVGQNTAVALKDAFFKERRCQSHAKEFPDVEDQAAVDLDVPEVGTIEPMDTLEEFQKEVLQCRADAEYFFSKYSYRSAFQVRQHPAGLFTAFGRTVRSRWGELLAKRYAPLVAKYFHGCLPSFAAKYNEARKQMAQKLQAEHEYNAARR